MTDEDHDAMVSAAMSKLCERLDYSKSYDAAERDAEWDACIAYVEHQFPEMTVGQITRAVTDAEITLRLQECVRAEAECMAFDGEPEGTLFAEAISKWLIDGRIYFPREVQAEAIRRVTKAHYSDPGVPMPACVRRMVERWQRQLN